MLLLDGLLTVLGLNVSHIPVPGSTAPSDSTDPEEVPHIVNLAYDFSWEGGGNMTTALGGSKYPFCAQVVQVSRPPYA